MTLKSALLPGQSIGSGATNTCATGLAVGLFLKMNGSFDVILQLI